MADSGWYPDPSGRNEQRFYDGARWTDHVASGGQQRVDPMQPAAPLATAVQPQYSVPTRTASQTVTKQGAWGLWWLCGLTFGIYYLVWYQRINKELSAVLGREHTGDGQWWSQFIPIYGLIGLARTAGRLNAAHTLVGSPTRVSPVTTWLWAPLWFSSQTRYLQRRINILHDIQASRMMQPAYSTSR
jgi:hypothetical protein